MKRLLVVAMLTACGGYQNQDDGFSIQDECAGLDGGDYNLCTCTLEYTGCCDTQGNCTPSQDGPSFGTQTCDGGIPGFGMGPTP